MANATTRVGSATVPWGDDKIKRPLAATVQTYHPGTMIALDSSGNATKCDNTAGLRFDGINAFSARVSENTGESAGDRDIMVSRPWRFQMYIASAAAGDEGKALYAAYDNEVSYSQTNSIFVGWVDQVLDATHVLVRPAWSGQAVGGVVGFDGATLTYTGATGGNTIVMPDNLADALSVKEGSNTYLKFVTTNSSEQITLLKLTEVQLGLTFTGATTVNVISMVDNLADALNIKEGSNSYLKFVTTNSSESIVLGKAATGVSLAVTAGLTSSGPTGAGIGYATGAGGAVTQITNRSTGVTLSKLTGTITTDTTSLAAGAEAEFTVTNTTVAATDTIIVSLASGSSGVGTCVPYVSAVASGSFKITITNQHASTAETGACVLNFTVIKGVAA